MRKGHESSAVAGVTISHPDRIVYPDLGITKLDVAKYYETVGDWIVPQVEGRPLTLVHCPNGMSGSCTFMKHVDCGVFHSCPPGCNDQRASRVEGAQAFAGRAEFPRPEGAAPNEEIAHGSAERLLDHAQARDSFDDQGLMVTRVTAPIAHSLPTESA